MIVEIANGADGGPLFTLNAEPGNVEDKAFIEKFVVGLPVSVVMTREFNEYRDEWLVIRYVKEHQGKV